MKKCLKCRATYEGHGGLRCSISGDSVCVDYPKHCVVLEDFNQRKHLYDMAGYVLTIRKTKIDYSDVSECKSCYKMTHFKSGTCSYCGKSKETDTVKNK